MKLRWHDLLLKPINLWSLPMSSNSVTGDSLVSKIGSKEQKFPISLKYLFYGHLSLIIPVVIAFTLLSLGYTGVRDSIESILCKFAFLYCLVLVFFALSNKLKSA